MVLLIEIINKFIVGIDFTGMNTRNNLMTVHLKTDNAEAYKANRMHIVLLSEQILEVGDVGVQVFD